MAMSDFCMNPASSSASVLFETSQFAQLDVLTYYSSCLGDDPFAPSIANILLSTQQLQTSLNSQQHSISTVCYNEISYGINYLAQQSAYLTNLTACGPIYADWSEFM